MLDAPRREPYRAKEETTEVKAGPAPQAPSGAPAETPPPSSASDRRITAEELHDMRGRESQPHSPKTQPLDISAVRSRDCVACMRAASCTHLYVDAAQHRIDADSRTVTFICSF